jgi:hypothetical protein
MPSKPRPPPMCGCCCCSSSWLPNSDLNSLRCRLALLVKPLHLPLRWPVPAAGVALLSGTAGAASCAGTRVLSAAPPPVRSCSSRSSCDSEMSWVAMLSSACWLATAPVFLRRFSCMTGVLCCCTDCALPAQLSGAHAVSILCDDRSISMQTDRGLLRLFDEL